MQFFAYYATGRTARRKPTARGFFSIITRRAGAVSPTDPDTPTDTDRQGQGATDRNDRRQGARGLFRGVYRFPV